MEWKHYKMDELIEEISMGPFGSDVKKEFYVDNGVPILNGSNLQGFKLQEDSFGYLTKEKADSLKKCNAHRGDIIVTHRGTLGQIVYVPVDSKYDRYVISQSQFRFRCKADLVDVQYLVYYFHTREGQYKILANASQVGVPALARATSTFRLIDIKLPPLDDQRRIASILSSLDRKIELNNKINADLEEMAQAIFKNWFVDFEPFKDGKFVDSELGMIPEGWKVGCLGDLITIKYGKDHKKLEDGTFPVYGSGGFMRFVNSWLYDGESVLIPRKGTLDNIMYVCEKFWTVDTMFFSVPKMDYVMKYVYNYIKRFDFSKMNEGTSVPSNTAARLNKMPILIPTHEILEMYDETLCPIYNKRKMKDKESRILSLLRDTLLPRLMSGELEVPE